MNMTSRTINAIRQSVFKELDRRCHIELGIRSYQPHEQQEGNEDGPNMLLWDEESDLLDTLLIQDFGNSKIDIDQHGLIMFDCYCYQFEPEGGSLIGNVYALIQDNGTCIGASSSYSTITTAISTFKKKKQDIINQHIWARLKAVDLKMDPNSPIGIIADYLEDHDLDVTKLRKAIKDAQTLGLSEQFAQVVSSKK